MAEEPNKETGRDNDPDNDEATPISLVGYERLAAVAAIDARLSEYWSSNLSLYPDRAERFAELCYKLWNGDERMYEPIREKKIRATVLGIVHCMYNSRPKEPGVEQGIWDGHYLNRQLRLETFFSPRECMEMFVEAGERRARADWRGQASESISAKIIRVRKHLQPNHKRSSSSQRGDRGKRKESLMDCTLEYAVKVSDLPTAAKFRIRDLLLEQGLPKELLPILLPNEHGARRGPEHHSTILHTSHALISNMCVAARGFEDSGMVPQEAGNLATLRRGDSKDAVMGMRTEDADRFCKKGAGKGLSAYPAQDRETLYLNHLCGVSRIEDTGSVDSDGNPMSEEKFGRISFFLEDSQAENGKFRKGILGQYRDTLGLTANFASLLGFKQFKWAEKKITNMLHPRHSKDLSPIEAIARKGSRLERIFAKCTSNIADISSANYEHVRDSVYLGSAGDTEGQIAQQQELFFQDMLQVTCVGKIDASAVRGTSTDKDRDARMRALVERVAKHHGSSRQPILVSSGR